jgi:hypothetical protein
MQSLPYDRFLIFATGQDRCYATAMSSLIPLNHHLIFARLFCPV